MATCSSNASRLAAPPAGSGRSRRRRCRAARSTSVQAEPRGGEQAADVVGERDVADQQHDRPARGGGDAERGRDGAVDPVGAAVGEHARRLAARREERLDVAHRHRGGDDERRVGGQPHAELGGDPRLAQPARAEHRGDRLRGGAVGALPVLEPARGARLARQALGERVERRARVGGGDRRDGAGGVLPGGLGVEARPAARRRAPASHWRSGLEVGRSPTRRTRSGACAAAQPGVAQQRVVVGDRGRAAAGARERVGQQRARRPARRTRPARRRAARRARRGRRRRRRAGARAAARRGRRAARRGGRARRGEAA